MRDEQLRSDELTEDLIDMVRETPGIVGYLVIAVSTRPDGPLPEGWRPFEVMNATKLDPLDWATALEAQAFDIRRVMATEASPFSPTRAEATRKFRGEG